MLLNTYPKLIEKILCRCGVIQDLQNFWINNNPTRPVRANDVEYLIEHSDWQTFCQKRAAFTQNSITKIIAQYPKWNWVICHSSYAVDFDGDEGKDWGYTHHELPISYWRTIGSVMNS